MKRLTAFAASAALLLSPVAFAAEDAGANKCEAGHWKRHADGGMSCELAAKPVLVDPKSGRLSVIKQAAKPGDKCTAKDGRPGIWLRSADGKLMRCKPSR